MASAMVQARVRVLAEPDETPENTPEDVRIYAEIEQGGDVVVLVQGADSVVVMGPEWERFCTEVMGAIIAARTTAEGRGGAS